MSLRESVKGWTRKASSWSAVGLLGAGTPAAALEAIAALPVFDASGSPCQDFSGPRPQYFIARIFGERFLVNTEGATYARYAVRLPEEKRERYEGAAGEQYPGTNYSVDELGFMQTAGAQLLAAVARGELDLNKIAKQELAARGLDYSGQWVGFERAKFLMSCSRVDLGGGKFRLVSVPENER